jgi:5-methylthioadenosine/S-adenosylhomocysteine deaminase
MQTVDAVIEARWVVPVDPPAVFEHTALAIDAGRIVAVAPIAQVAARFAPRERISCPHHVLLPGFVNAHTHAAMTLLRTLPIRGPLMQWLNETIWPAERRAVTAEFVRCGSALAMAELLQAGITCFADMYFFPDEVARLARAHRLRVAIGLPVVDAPTPWAASADEHLEKAGRLWDEYRSDAQVSMYFAPHSPYAVSRATFTRLRRVVDQLDAPIGMHLHETQTEIRDSLAAHGERPLSWLAAEGLLRPGFAAVHMNWLSDDDLDLVARSGIGVVHCPQSNQRLGSGTCPVPRLQALDVPVALGTDGPASVGALDLIAEMRAACLVANQHDANPRALSPHDALRAATLGGATVLGLAAGIGSLSAGKAADLIAVDLSALACQPLADPVEALVFGATRDAVSDVWIAGRAMVREHRLLAFDAAELAAEARAWTARLTLGVAA